MRMAPYARLTEGEVREFCERYEMEYEDIPDWYDGYIVSDWIPVPQRQ